LKVSSKSSIEEKKEDHAGSLLNRGTTQVVEGERSRRRQPLGYFGKKKKASMNKRATHYTEKQPRGGAVEKSSEKKKKMN